MRLLLVFCGLLFFVLYVTADVTKPEEDQALSKRRAPGFRHLGCFRDRPARALPVKLGYFRRNAKRHCARLARLRGFLVFALQHNGHCYSGRNGLRTYSRYGMAGQCRRGVGGVWANDVYRFRSLPYRSIGCFRDTHRRALPVFFGDLRKYGINAIPRCARIAKARGYRVFSVQYGGQCFSGPTAEKTYAKYGRRNNCRGGIGGFWSNNVYRITQKRGRKFIKINRNRVCFQTRGNRPGIFRYYGPNRIVNGLLLVHRNGKVTCHYHNRRSYSRWGCGGNQLNVVVTDQYNYLIYPLKQYIGKHLWYRLPGKHSKHSRSLFFSNVAAPFQLSRSSQLKVWYGEDLINWTEPDNRGHGCVDVYAWFA